MKLFFATTNAAKVTSVARVLGGYGIGVERVDLDLPELQADTAEEIATGKVRAALSALRERVIVVDSAFHIDALGGFPGPYVKHVTAKLGVDGYLDLLARHQDPAARGCAFVDAVALADPSLPAPLVFVRRERGTIAPERRGDPVGHKSPVATLFVPEGCEKTIAEMAPDELLAYRSRPSTEKVYHDLAAALTGGQSFEE
ncbi:MAG TPA: non-canonical purine NTP pyrophosphatase [Candidatus Binatia bacterium]|jgi:non-canonical purine NTP pyrophosphatase (RdgB/HAM1 family)|nr:non-canonical purine NTP pyrophosphatase [Candidatus Binatia bacterium]